MTRTGCASSAAMRPAMRSAPWASPCRMVTSAGRTARATRIVSASVHPRDPQTRTSTGLWLLVAEVRPERLDGVAVRRPDGDRFTLADDDEASVRHDDVGATVADDDAQR